MPERSDIRLLCGDIAEAVERILQYTSDMASSSLTSGHGREKP